MAYETHKHAAEGTVARCAVLTVSDTRTVETDASGRRIVELLAEAGHSLVERSLVRDDAEAIGVAVDAWLVNEAVDAILITGGTGIGKRDVTVAVVEKRLESVLSGFGELFRMLSHQQIGSGAMLSRAVGGIARGKVVFAMPGSSKAVELAMGKLILPELGHILHESRK